MGNPTAAFAAVDPKRRRALRPTAKHSRPDYTRIRLLKRARRTVRPVGFALASARRTVRPVGFALASAQRTVRPVRFALASAQRTVRPVRFALSARENLRNAVKMRLFKERLEMSARAGMLPASRLTRNSPDGTIS